MSDAFGYDDNPASPRPKKPRKIDKLFPTQQGFLCFMDDGTVWMWSGVSWRYVTDVPQGPAEEPKEKPSGIIG
jgi:hypothetical protein